MKRVIVALLFLATPCVADDNRADDAIRDAVDLLQLRRARITEQGELDKLDQAIERLKGSTSAARTETRRVPGSTESPADRAPSLPSVKIADFIDHTERYKGQIVTLPLMVRSRALIPPGQNLRALSGGAARFQGSSNDGNRLDLMIDLPRSLEIPKLSFGDRAIVSFRCQAGDLQRGNEAVEIRRPEKD